ncbi:MAG TPA: AbrB/MazE/SpoVT family DNA-binding domain-containing protein [Allosphingosinicella sp.]|nr:AbrB/MazE/SpoVT family DNA-binding domain-containing protein [Allosphingosinicella sp.]
MPAATMTSKGQITVPAEVRSKFGLRAGTRVDFAENDAGELVMRPRTGDIRALRGIVEYRGPPVSLEDINKAIGEAVAEEFKRSVS